MWMKRGLWAAQIILALFFVFAVVGRSMMPEEDLATNSMLSWVLDMDPTVLLVISVLEILGAIGLILPAVTRIMPQLTAWAAAGLAVTMIGAAVFHFTRGEYASIIGNIIWFALAAFVAYGRFKLHPIPARGQETPAMA